MLQESPPRERRTRQGPARVVLVLLTLIFLLAVAGGASALSAGLRNLSAVGVTQRAAPSPTTPPVCRSASAVTAVPAPAPGSTGYPSLASSYAGTIYDYLAKEKTALCLMNIQQSRDNISGAFQGLGLAGPFQGKVTTDEQLSFTVSLYAGTELIVCEGTIKVGGDIRGSFRVYNQQGDFTGEFGDWNASVYAQEALRGKVPFTGLPVPALARNSSVTR